MKKKMYVHALVPDFAENDWRFEQYGAWYVGHNDLAQLDDEVLQNHYHDFARQEEVTQGEEMERFATYLEGKEYTIFNTAGEGWATIPVDEAAGK